MEIVTRGLGAGSYPEPPRGHTAWMEQSFPDCENCGYDYEERLTYYKGKRLCPLCREKAIIRDSQPADRRRFIHDNLQIQKDFYVHFWFDSMDDLEKVYWLRRIFEYESRPNSAVDQEICISDYIRQQSEAFTNFMERM